MRTIVRAFLLGWSLLPFNTAAFSQKVDKSVPDTISSGGVIGLPASEPGACGTHKQPPIIFVHGMGERGGNPSQVHATTINSFVYTLQQRADMHFTACGQTSSFVIISPRQDKSYGLWPFLFVKEWMNYAKGNLQTAINMTHVTGLSPGGGALNRRYAVSDILCQQQNQINSQT